MVEMARDLLLNNNWVQKQYPTYPPALGELPLEDPGYAEKLSVTFCLPFAKFRSIRSTINSKNVGASNLLEYRRNAFFEP